MNDLGVLAIELATQISGPRGDRVEVDRQHIFGCKDLGPLRVDVSSVFVVLGRPRETPRDEPHRWLGACICDPWGQGFTRNRSLGVYGSHEVATKLYGLIPGAKGAQVFYSQPI